MIIGKEEQEQLRRQPVEKIRERLLEVPDFAALSEAEQLSIVAQFKGIPEVREQPGTVERAVQPGGIASPENVGIVGGALLGAKAGGLAFGPPGMVLGGLAGAGVGAMAGRGSELAVEELERQGLLAPARRAGATPETPIELTESPSAMEVIGELGEASSRGIAIEAGSQLMGAGISRIISGDPRVRQRANVELAELAKRHGIDLTAAETKRSAKGAILESIPGRFPAGVETTTRFLRRRAQQVEKAALDIAEELSPGSRKDYVAIGDLVKNVGSRKLSRLSATTKVMIEKVGRPKDLLSAGEEAITSKQSLYRAAQGAADRLYALARKMLARDLGDDALNNITATNFTKVAREISAKSASLKGVKTKPERVVGALKVEPTSEIMFGGTAVSPQDLPASIVAQLGLDQPKSFTFDALRAWQSRLQGLASNTTDRLAKKQFLDLFDAVSEDIAQLGVKSPQGKVLLDRARDFYRAKIADIFLNPENVRKLDKQAFDKIASYIIRPNGSEIPIHQARRAIGPEKFNTLVASYLDDIRRQATGPDGVFSPDAFLNKISSHRPEVLTAILGEKADPMNALMRLLANSPRALLKTIEGRETDRLMELLVRPGTGTKTLRELRGMMSPGEWNEFGSAWLKDLIVNKSRDSETGLFSPARFLNHFSGQRRFAPEQVRVLLGSEAARDVNDVVKVLDRIAETRGAGLNVSETARGLLSFGQVSGGIILAAQVAGDIIEGRALRPGELAMNIGQGMVLLSPLGLGKLLYSRGGARLLTRALTIKPGTQQAINTAARIMTILASPEPEAEPSGRVAAKQQKYEPIYVPQRETHPIGDFPVGLRPQSRIFGGFGQ